MLNEQIEIKTYEGEGYQPVIDFESWRVAILRYCGELEIQNIKTMQKHDQTDEAFLLLDGNCTLFVGGRGESVGQIEGIKMEPMKIYNIKKGVWHSHTLDKKGMVLIVENQNTCDENSPTKSLNENQLRALCNACT